MKKIFIVLLLAFSGWGMQAQDTAEWHTDLNKAITVSNKTHKPLFLFFTGSDWCGWCIKLQKEVFKTPEFTKWAKDNVVLVELDFPRRTQQSEELKVQNAQLNNFFKVRGYPTVWITDVVKTNDGKTQFSPRGSTGYVAGGPSAWLDGANKIMVNKT
ncbi:thioredoxin family protein [Flavobacterium sp. DG1-102-2]|uniref:thioredoxin family protein n=1 Tax=Flavobacterium sp. DG1-102-2 TaxID=3081663 RepID=UPI00294A2259|nr:thioredoxin family protein [Flavobacterium sp. DG1-102-2]MDV6168951.1 thioredoxin family protein [Flavobacterium sp. DG1-102-2]